MQIEKLYPLVLRTFRWHLYTRINERYLLPADRQAGLARFFNCRIEKLLNYEPPPLALEGITQHGKAELAKKLKLVK